MEQPAVHVCNIMGGAALGRGRGPSGRGPGSNAAPKTKPKPSGGAAGEKSVPSYMRGTAATKAAESGQKFRYKVSSPFIRLAWAATFAQHIVTCIAMESDNIGME
eukprot:scaffold132691_cov27-Prasinocladus_malaysianus.AAC.1